ncbi:DinB family protein, partial [Flavihumibacter sp. CACIAM 22H1]|uniref:DinB family protein n=1 Tax=Flavihumibacter sp. CACIAM 22H1 TaxID=1812911 RepID=UPI0025BCD46B
FTQAQQSIDQIVKDWERAKAYTKEYLDAMPAAAYASKPTPEMRSFADQMLHLSDANYMLIAQISGVASPIGEVSLEKQSDKSKENVTRLVLAGYDFVIDNIRKMTPEQLKASTKLFNSFDMTKEVALSKAFEHQTHHRGQTTAYIRMAGATPPQEKLF